MIVGQVIVGLVSVGLVSVGLVNATHSFEVECDIRQFIENYPSRESHYCNSLRTGRKYLGPDKNMTSIHKEFSDKYQEYNNYVQGFARGCR